MGRLSFARVPALAAARQMPLLLLAAMLVPMLTFGAVAWIDRAAVVRDGMRRVQDAAEICSQQAIGVLHTNELVAATTAQHVAGMSWQDIGASAALHDYLRRLDDAYPEVQGIWLVDAAGNLRNSSVTFPAPAVNLADRDYFIALRARDVGTAIGQMVSGHIVTKLHFNVARRRETADGHFDGVVVVSTFQDQLAKFWRAVSPQPGSTTALIRGDGIILARQPELPSASVQPPITSRLRQLVQSGQDRWAAPAGSVIDGVERYYVLRRVGDYDVYIIHGVAVATVLAEWYEELRLFGALFLVAAAALTAVAFVALRETRREQIATARWQAAAQAADNELQRRVAAEAQLRESQKLEVLGHVASCLAHDFGNVLTVVLGSLENLQGHQDDPRLERMVQTALRAAQKGAGAIRTLLAFARRQPSREELCNPNLAMRGMQELLQQALGSRCRLEADLAPDVAPVLVDANQFEMAMLNLAVNARDAMPSGGTFRIRTGNVTLAGTPENLSGDFVRIAVTDTGTGIPPEIAARVFEPFFTTKPEGAGTGLGLSQVRRFARQSGGAATLESTVGGGTTILLYLPAAGAREAASRPGAPAVADTAPAPA